MAVAIRENVVDFRQALVRKLASITLERRRLEARLNVIAEVEKELKSVLDITDQPMLPHVEATTPVKEAVEAHQGSAVKQFLYALLSHEGPKTLEQLVDAAHERHFDFGQKSARRTLHFHLLNLKNSRAVEKDGDFWRVSVRKSS